MEVSSSTETSSPQQASNSVMGEVSSQNSQTALAVVTTSSEGTDGLNNAMCAEAVSVPLDAAVCYGPSLPSSFYPSDSFQYSKDVKDSNAVSGSCGLYNLGNTCFMNSGLQSLFSCAPLVKFFSENYNLTEDFGNTLTAQFYILLCKVWSGQFSVVHPRAFKDFLGFYHSQFEDYRQHDCQEFLALVLDTLHEQLNTSEAALGQLVPAPVSIPQTIPVSNSISSGAIPLPWREAISNSSNFQQEHKLYNDRQSHIGSDNDSFSNANCVMNDVPSSSSVSHDCLVKREQDVGLPDSPTALATSACVVESPPHQISPREGSLTSEASLIDTIPSPFRHEGPVDGKSPDMCEDEEISSSLFPSLKRYTSRSNLDDVTSSDCNTLSKPCLKRVSSVNTVTASGIQSTSEDSNQSSLSAHSTDSEQSSAFKKLKIEIKDLNKNGSNHLKDFVTSTSDYKNFHKVRKCLGEEQQGVLREAQGYSVSSNVSDSRDIKVIDNMMSMHGEGESHVHPEPSHQEAYNCDHSLPMGLSNLEDYYSKETKTLNTNVLVSDFLQEITSDSEKFAKVDNRNRSPSKEVNILQDGGDEDDKAEKVLLGQRFSGGVKKNNLFSQASGASLNKAIKNKDPNILNNSLSFSDNTLVVGQVSKFALDQTDYGSGKMVVEEQPLSLKLAVSSSLSPGASKLDEEEKNIQIQAFAKFNTRPVQSNLRTDLTPRTLDADAMELDEVEAESSEEEEEAEVTSQNIRQSVEECSAVPNCLRHCPPPSEIAMANQAWDEYLSRNRSSIVNTFQGQFRSTVVCSECSHVSVTYEPFMYLSLPIPHAMEQQLSVTYISLHNEPVRYLLNLLKTDKIGTAKSQLLELIGQQGKEVVIAEVLDSHISRILDDNVLLKYVNIVNRKIYAFEAVSIETVTDEVSDSLPCQQVLNNEESSVLHYDCELPSTCREELSNQSFDSVNVNSPSSRDTLDYVLSDNEPCESSGVFFPLALNTCAEEDENQECQSTSDERVNRPCQKRNSPTLVQRQTLNEALTQNATVSSDVFMQDSVHPDNSMDDNSNLCSTSSFWTDGCEERAKSGSAFISRDVASSDRPVTLNESFRDNQDTCSSHSLRKLIEDSLNKNSNLNCVPTSSSATTRVDNAVVSSRGNANISSTSGFGSSGNSSKHSRSCPSPEQQPVHGIGQDSTLMAVAARLEVEEPGSYFLQPSPQDAEYNFYPDEDPADRINPSQQEQPDPCKVETSWSAFPGNESVNAQAGPSGPDSSSSAMPMGWRSCAICLEDLMDAELLTHVDCGGVFCHNCLQMSLKHTADEAIFCCPICLQPANVCEDFVPLASASTAKPKIRMLSVCIAYRHNVRDNTGTNTLQLYGHPNILYTPSVISGQSLYLMVDSLLSNMADGLIGPALATYSILLTDGQGLGCSRCPYSIHCTGCEVSRDGDVSLQPSDCLTVHLVETLTTEEIQDLSLVRDDISMEGQRSSQPTTIMDCFGAFTQSETLDEHNPWYCPQCDQNQCAKKTMTVWRYPDNLIIHLKRFVYQDLSSTKVDAKVIFPHTEMDVRGFLSGPSTSRLVYDLYSTVCHFGSASAGHYTCFARHPLTSQWYYYNDETVTQQMPSDSEYSSGYLLFYQRQGPNVDFVPPQNPAFLEEESNIAQVNTNGQSVTSQVTTNNQFVTSVTATSSSVSTTSSTHNNTTVTVNVCSNKSVTSCSEATVIQPPTSSSSCVPQNLLEEDDEEEEDYDVERRSSLCVEESLVVHFGSSLPQNPDHWVDEESVAEDLLIAEPDSSTLEFYS